MPKVTIIKGHVLDALRRLPDESVDCIITSPPYWGLRDYGEAACRVWEGDDKCCHKWETVGSKKLRGTNNGQGAFCVKCGAWYGQLGLEPTLDMYLKHMLLITAELKRVLTSRGVMFWVHGDCYIGSGAQQAKCMALQNYRLVLRMVDEQGWILRNIIIWYKPNHMPCSAKDRFTNSYETVFMLVKNLKYWFDLDSVRVPHKTVCSPPQVNKLVKHDVAVKRSGNYSYADPLHTKPQHILGKNPGDLWSIPTQPFREAHFATFPEALIAPMIEAGCPPKVCTKCGEPAKRIVEHRTIERYELPEGDPRYRPARYERKYKKNNAQRYSEHRLLGWTDCGCGAKWRPGIVLDPFLGSGTTAVVAVLLQRDCVGIEINPDYVKMATRRIQERVGLLADIKVEETNDAGVFAAPH